MLHKAVEALTDLDSQGLQEWVVGLGGKPFQSRQLEHWIYKHGVQEYAECLNLPKALRQAMEQSSKIMHSKVSLVETSSDGTRKFLCQLSDGENIECVLIPDNKRSTLCISTQVGCPVGCVFCASGLNGVRRNLLAGEMVEQVLHARRLISQEQAGPLTNLVVMGIGEPMLNLDNLMPALERIHDPDGINLGARRITVSTSGYPDRIDKFATAPHPYNLAISLHAANDALRQKLVPTAKASVEELIAAAKRYFASTGRQVTFEVVLLADINDRPRNAQDIIRKLRGFSCTINLLPWNPVAQIPELRRPVPHRVDNFARLLRDGGLNVTVRRQRGADRSAACGQLRIAQQ